MKSTIAGFAVLAMLVGACSTAAQGTPSPAATGAVATASPTPSQTPTATPSSTPVPVPLSWRHVQATAGKGSRLAVTSDAVISFGVFSEMADKGDTFRLLMKVKNTGTKRLEIHQAGATDDQTTTSYVVIHYNDGRVPRNVGASTIWSQLSAGDETWLLSGEVMTADEYASIMSVEAIVEARTPKFDFDAWKGKIDNFDTSGDSFTVTGTFTNLLGNETMNPLVLGILFDANDQPITYGIGQAPVGGTSVGDDFAYTLTETLPSGMAGAAATIRVYPESSVDKWSDSGDMARDLLDLLR